MLGIARFLRNATSSQPQRRLAALKALSGRLVPGYRMTWHQLDWWHDRDFNAFLDRFGERDGLNTHRKWSLWQLLRLTAGVAGDTAECGIFEGSSSWLICAANRTREPRPTHHLFDSFEGLSCPEGEDGGHWQAGSLAVSEEVVARNLAPFIGEIRFHKGWIPERFADVADRTFSFVHVDVDLYQPTRDSLLFFYDRLAPGGVLLCDDYGFSTCPGATKAIDECLAGKPEKMVALDAGGGFFIKGVTTAAASAPVPTAPGAC